MAAFYITTVMTLAIAVVSPAAEAQTCNPVIDGTYCATQMPKTRASTSSSAAGVGNIRSIGSDLAIGQDQPATIGAITFRGNGERCVGGLFRGGCN